MNFDSATFSRTTLSTHATRTPPPTQVPATHRPVPDASPACSLQRCSPPHSLTPSPSIPARLAPVRAWHGASESLIVAPADPWSTPVERSDFVSTPSYDETRAWLQGLAAVSPLLSLEVFGKTSEGRDLLVRAQGQARKAGRAGAGRHPRRRDRWQGRRARVAARYCQRGKDDLLDEVDFVFVPILNSDDHEQRGPLIGAALRGPQQIGWNTTTRGINLNRDYLNLEAQETRATSSCCTRATQRCISTCMSAAGSIISTTSPLPLPAGAPTRARARLRAGCSSASPRPSTPRCVARGTNLRSTPA